LKPHYDFIICGSGSSGSVVARRLAENPEVSVLLLEAGGSDDVPSIAESLRWPENLYGEHDWCFKSLPNPQLNGRSLPLSMGKVLGGGSSINVMCWSRGHKSDWDHFAAEAGDDAWNYQSVLGIYRRIEDWQGAPDPARRGTGGLVFVQPAPDPHPLAAAMVEGAASVGIPSFEDQNGVMMEGDGGAAIGNVRVRDGKRLSVFRSYVYPVMDRPNLTVLTHALVTRLVFSGKQVSGVEVEHGGKLHRIGATREVVLSMGAIQTPKVLMQSGIGDEAVLKRFGIPVVQHLPGVGQNYQDHYLLGCIWESPMAIDAHNNMAESTCFWKSDATLDTPDLQWFSAELPFVSPDATDLPPPQNCWSLSPGLVRPASRGEVRLTGPDPRDPIEIDSNYLSDPTDFKAMKTCVEICREIGNSAAMRPFRLKEFLPGNLKGQALDTYIRNSVSTYWHQTCTAKMGRDAMSVVDGRLKVYGIDKLRIADGSIMPRVTSGNTMAPCVVIGERAGEVLKADHHM
ncbi:MAG: GMC family oxidoreductase N-terminal domain-containing protein, partial [Dongiaceae bacterium]